MTPDRWRQIEEVYHAALEQNPGQLACFLDRACYGDPELRSEVESLLAQEAVVGPVDRPLLAGGANFPTAAAGSRALDEGATVGRYRVIRLVGEGGMGVVYEAQQQQPRRLVALKIIRSGLVSAELRRRFEQEAQALGRLQHPGIAQIYEAGTDDTGSGPQPYIAMEFIRGEALREYTAAHHLNTRQRLDLMAKVCDAIQHAHQRGLIHRDLKPGNILVDETGQPKILDFGVACVTDGDAPATRHTDLGQLVGTLAYMSPEQLLGDPLELDTRSDVYALGVILYELLAGRMPYTLSRKLPEAVQTIREKDPSPLSTFKHRYRGDIETIVAKALEKEKIRRYSSAADMAADLRHYLHDEPIAARPPSASYHLQKFARRHKSLVGAAAAVLLVLLAGTAASTWQALRATAARRVATQELQRALRAEEAATRERNRALAAEAQARQDRNTAVAQKKRADAESAAAKAVNEFLQNDLLAQASAITQAGPKTNPDPDLKVRTALDRAAARIAGKFDRQPLVEASIRQTIGTTYLNLGLYAEAQRQIERAVEIRQKVLGGSHPYTLDSMHNLASTYLFQGQYAQAEALYSDAVAARRRVLGAGHRDTLASMSDLAVLYQRLGKYLQAEALTTSVLDSHWRAVGEEDANTLNMMGNLALLYKRQGKSDQAAALYRKVLEIELRVRGEQSPATLITMNNLAVTYLDQAKYAQAEPLMTHVLEVRRHILGEEHAHTLVSIISLGALYTAEGKYAQSELLLTKAVAVARRVLGEEHPTSLTAMANLGQTYRSQGKYAEAETLFLRDFEVSRKRLGAEHPDTLVSMSNLAQLYRYQGKYGEAEAMFAAVLDGRRGVLGPEHPNTTKSLILLGQVRVEQHKYAEGEPLLRAGLDNYEKRCSDDWLRYHAQTLLGASLAGQGKYAEAEPQLLSGYQGLLARQATIPAERRRTIGQAAEWIVRLYQDWGKIGNATEWRENIARR